MTQEFMNKYKGKVFNTGRFVKWKKLGKEMTDTELKDLLI